MARPQQFGRVLLVAAVFLGVILFSPHASAAGSLYITPPSGTFTVDSTFSISIYMNTGGQSVNAVQADLTFPPDKLQVISPTAGKSIVQIWVSQPTYSNEQGTLRFRGIVPTPGIQTDAGLISTITFRVKGTGTAVIKLNNDTSKILLNDGKGTDILGQTTAGIYYLTLPPPAGPIVVSPTNPDQEEWYATKNVIFRWNSPGDSQGYSYILNDLPIDEPDEISEGTKTSVAYKDLPDGIHYFHIKGLRAGVWGGVTSYAVKIDNTPPAAFTIGVSPGKFTSNKRLIFDFLTTDAASGVDHYELKIIPLDLPQAKIAANETPFFIEATPPYSRVFDIGTYDVVVRAYDKANNYSQTTARIHIINPIFEVLDDNSVRIGGSYVIGWPYLAAIAILLLALLLYFARIVWWWHRRIEKQLEAGARVHPSVATKVEELKQKQKEYRMPPDGLKAVVIFLVIGSIAFGFLHAASAESAMPAPLPAEPPVVSLFPGQISNDEIFYIGGRTTAPNAQVLIYIQNIQTEDTFSQIVATDKDGSWFYSFPQFFEPGKYIVWTQLKIHDVMSPPSSKLDLVVAPTAIQIGGNRLSYQDFYFVLFLAFVLVSLILVFFIAYHFYHSRKKSRMLAGTIKDAEESVRRGFAVLRKDMESELEIIRRAKIGKELSEEEKKREEKLLKDLEDVNSYIGSEIWKIEEADKDL